MRILCSNLANRMALTLLVAAILGCGHDGPPVYLVKGKITHRGQAVTTGTVSFIPSQGPMTVANIDNTGQYALRTRQGSYRIAIVAVPAVPGDPLKMPGGYVAPTPLVPPKYGRIATSGLTADVQPLDANAIDFELP